MRKFKIWKWNEWCLKMLVLLFASAGNIFHGTQDHLSSLASFQISYLHTSCLWHKAFVQDSCLPVFLCIYLSINNSRSSRFLHGIFSRCYSLMSHRTYIQMLSRRAKITVLFLVINKITLCKLLLILPFLVRLSQEIHSAVTISFQVFLCSVLSAPGRLPL